MRKELNQEDFKEMVEHLIKENQKVVLEIKAKQMSEESREGDSDNYNGNIAYGVERDRIFDDQIE